MRLGAALAMTCGESRRDQLHARPSVLDIDALEFIHSSAFLAAALLPVVRTGAEAAYPTSASAPKKDGQPEVAAGSGRSRSPASKELDDFTPLIGVEIVPIGDGVTMADSGKELRWDRAISPASPASLGSRANDVRRSSPRESGAAHG